MRFTVTLKSPDCCWHAIDGELKRYKEELLQQTRRNIAIGQPHLDLEDIDGCLEERQHEMYVEVERWLRNAEYLTVELDTEAHTATVVKP